MRHGLICEPVRTPVGRAGGMLEDDGETPAMGRIAALAAGLVACVPVRPAVLERS